MTETHTQVLSAFLDGEVVDPDRLAAALGDPAGRAALVDFVRLREAVTSNAPLPLSLERLRADAPLPKRSVSWWRAVVVSAGMALLIVTVLALFQRLKDVRTSEDSPPAPSRTVRYVPGVDWHSEAK
jgi:negative regulator of sigma E activity